MFVYCIRAIKRSNCFHQKKPSADCNAKVSGNLLMLIYGGIEIIFSQFPSLEKITILSVVATIMSFGYSFIALCLCIEKFASNPQLEISDLIGVKVGEDGITHSTKVWQSFQALGNIAFAYTFANILIEIQVHLRIMTLILVNVCYWELCLDPKVMFYSSKDKNIKKRWLPVKF